MSENNVKTVRTRDQATALFRKIGINKIVYDIDIAKSGEAYEVDTFNAKLFLAEKDKAAMKKTLGRYLDKTSATPKHESVASFIRQLITVGKTNEEVFAAAQKLFKLPDSKKSYPCWYRAEMIRKSRAA